MSYNIIICEEQATLREIHENLPSFLSFSPAYFHTFYSNTLSSIVDILCSSIRARDQFLHPYNKQYLLCWLTC